MAVEEREVMRRALGEAMEARRWRFADEAERPSREVIVLPETRKRAEEKTRPERSQATSRRIMQGKDDKFEAPPPPPEEEEPGYIEKVSQDIMDILKTPDLSLKGTAGHLFTKGAAAVTVRGVQHLVTRQKSAKVKHQEYRQETHRRSRTAKENEKYNEALEKYTQELRSCEIETADEAFCDDVLPALCPTRTDLKLPGPEKRWEKTVGVLAKKDLGGMVEKVAKRVAKPSSRTIGFAAIGEAARKQAKNQLERPFREYQEEQHFKRHPLERCSNKDLLRLLRLATQDTEEGSEREKRGQREAREILQRRIDGRSATAGQPSFEDLLEQATEDSVQGVNARQILSDFAKDVRTRKEIPQDYLDVIRKIATPQDRKEALERSKRHDPYLAEILEELPEDNDGVPEPLLAVNALARGLEAVAALSDKTRSGSKLPCFNQGLTGEKVKEPLTAAFRDEIMPQESGGVNPEELAGVKHPLMSPSVLKKLAGHQTTAKEAVLMTLLFDSPGVIQDLKEILEACRDPFEAKMEENGDADEPALFASFINQAALNARPPGKWGELPTKFAETMAGNVGEFCAMLMKHSTGPGIMTKDGVLSTKESAEVVAAATHVGLKNLPAQAVMKTLEPVTDKIGSMAPGEIVGNTAAALVLKGALKNPYLKKDPQELRKVTAKVGEVLEYMSPALVPSETSLGILEGGNFGKLMGVLMALPSRSLPFTDEIRFEPGAGEKVIPNPLAVVDNAKLMAEPPQYFEEIEELRIGLEARPPLSREQAALALASVIQGKIIKQTEPMLDLLRQQSEAERTAESGIYMETTTEEMRSPGQARLEYGETATTLSALISRAGGLHRESIEATNRLTELLDAVGLKGGEVIIDKTPEMSIAPKQRPDPWLAELDSQLPDKIRENSSLKPFFTLKDLNKAKGVGIRTVLAEKYAKMDSQTQPGQLVSAHGYTHQQIRKMTDSLKTIIGTIEEEWKNRD